MVQRLTTRAKQGEDDGVMLLALLEGKAYENDEHGRPLHVPDDDELRAEWEQLRDELLPEFIAKNPGHRPWAWWRFSAPTPHNRPLHIEFQVGGVRKRNRLPLGGECRSYLEEHGLLTNEEREALGPQ